MARTLSWAPFPRSSLPSPHAGLGRTNHRRTLWHLSPLLACRSFGRRYALVIDPGRDAEATLKVWVPDRKTAEPVERRIVIDQFLRGIEKLPSIVQIPRLVGLPAWQGFVKAIRGGDLVMLEWTVEAGPARSAQPGGEVWRARLIAQREGKQVAEFIIRATSAPCCSLTRPHQSDRTRSDRRHGRMGPNGKNGRSGRPMASRCRASAPSSPTSLRW